MNEWWYPSALGGLVFLGGFVAARFPSQTLGYLDLRAIPVHGFPRTVGGIRVMGIVFTVIGACMVILGVLDLFGVVDLSP